MLRSASESGASAIMAASEQAEKHAPLTNLCSQKPIVRTRLKLIHVPSSDPLTIAAMQPNAGRASDNAVTRPASMVAATQAPRARTAGTASFSSQVRSLRRMGGPPGPTESSAGALPEPARRSGTCRTATVSAMAP